MSTGASLGPLSVYPDPWRLAAGALLLIAFCVEIYFIYKKQGFGQGRWQSYLLRALGCLAVAVLMLEPAWLHSLQKQEPAKVIVLVDQSASMSIQDFNTATKAKARYRRLNERWKKQSADLPFELRAFGEELGKRLQGELFPGPPSQPYSRLSAALQRVGQSSAPLSAILVLSDGLVAVDEQELKALQESTRSLGVPVSFANISQHKRRDLAIVSAEIPEFCFAQNASDLSVTVRREGTDDREHRVELWRDDEELDHQILRFAPGQNQAKVEFRYTPQRTGEFIYSIRVRPVGEEATLGNNQIHRLVRVLRDKVRILHVAGRPDWDVRFLRRFLKRNPNVELLSYYILRDEEDQMRDDPNAPMSLIQFPHKELFEEQLGSFDLIILQNFDATTRANYNRNFGQFVLDGGTIAVVGGDLGLPTGDYSVPPLSELLPAKPWVEDMQKTPTRTRLSLAGRNHPISAWMAKLMKEGSLALPPLDNYNRSSPQRQEGNRNQVLIQTVPSGQGSAYPLLAVAEPGKGRVIEFLSASSWRWGFSAGLEGIDGLRPYERLWQEIIRWSLREDPALVRLKVSALISDPQRELSFNLSTHRADGQAQADVPLSLRILRGTKELLRRELRSDAKGQARVRFRPRERGTLKVEVSRPALSSGDEELTIRKTLIIGATNPDLRQLDPQPLEAQLRSIIEGSGGRYWRDSEIPDQMLAELPRRSPSPKELSSRARAAGQAVPKAIWDHPLVWLLLFCFPAEWWLRRRRAQDGGA